MYHVLRSVDEWNVVKMEGFESTVQVFGEEKLFSEQFKALKTLVTSLLANGIESRLHSRYAETTWLRWICSESNNFVISPLVSPMEDQTNLYGN